MAAQVVQNSSAQELGRQTQEAQNNAPANGNGTGSHAGQGYPSGDLSRSPHKRASERMPSSREQNPELLQWRANVLLDEMMLGAVDIAASDTVQISPPVRPAYNGPAPNQPRTEVRETRQPNQPPTPHPTGYRNSAYAEVTDELAPSAAAQSMTPSDPQDEWLRPSWHFAEPTAPTPPPALPSSQTSSMTPAARSNTLQEQTRYQQTTPTTPPSRIRATGQPPNTPDIRTTAVGAPATRTTPALTKNAAGTNATGGNNTEQWVFAAEQRYQQIAVRHQSPPPGGPNGAGNGSAAQWVDPVDALFDNFGANDYASNNGIGQGGARLRANQAIRRSNLLPRMSNLDPRTLQQEMVLLQTEIEQALPAGHESRERALRLLQKAYTILHDDASRSAEVDYYLQQVRTISQRVQETLHWSTLYHSRLNLYLSAWTTLSLIVITACYVYQERLARTIATFGNPDLAADSLLPYNLLTAFTGFFAGALGGALGAFINLHYSTQRKQGFFDRKYSLRGLILPLIGGIVGLVLCLFFGLIYYLFQADPATNLLLGALPALLAFLFGIAQESIYGTRR